MHRWERNPYEYGSTLVSTTGSSASKCSACCARSSMVGIPNGLSWFLSLLFGIYNRLKGSERYPRRLSNKMAPDLAAEVDHMTLSKPGVSLPLFFCHPFDSKCFASKRVDQQPLQSFHLAPAAFLCTLHDTRRLATPLLRVGVLHQTNVFWPVRRF